LKFWYRYWNPSQKKEFFDKVMNLWTKDVVAPSRLEELEEIVNGPKIQIGAGGEEELKKLETSH